LHFYLPIAEVSVNALLLVALGGARGLHLGPVRHRRRLPDDAGAGVHGHPPVVAVASEANHVAASSVSSVIAYSRSARSISAWAGCWPAAGRSARFLGVEVFRWLRLIGQADLAVSLSYLVFLGVIGG
jgi:hypothetical protein